MNPETPTMDTMVNPSDAIVEIEAVNEEQTISGVRVLFNNGQTFDLPTISNLDESEPEFEAIVQRFRDEEWLKLGASNIAINSASVAAISEIRIKVTNNPEEAAAEQSPDANQAC